MLNKILALIKGEKGLIGRIKILSDKLDKFLPQSPNEDAKNEITSLEERLDIFIKKFEGYQIELSDKIRAQEKHLLNVLNESADGIISFDRDEKIMTWNRGAELIYGYKALEVIGNSLETLIPVNLKSSGELEKMRRILREKGVIRHFETERYNKNGNKIIVDITRTVLKNEEGKIIGYSAIVKDITEKKEFEKKIVQTEKLTTIGQISANIAHELKNPLMGISGAVQVLIKKLADNPSAKDTLIKIFEQVQRLDNTLKGLLSFARPQTPYFLKGNVNEIIEQILFFVSPEANTKNVKIIKDLDGSLPQISLDPEQIKQVFLNIILNSIQAMPLGGDLKIETSRSNGNFRDDIKIIISDTGVGIPHEIRDDIFKPFFTTKVKGTGLGLVITKNIIKEHKGDIFFKSKLNRGTSFEITLPIEQQT